MIGWNSLTSLSFFSCIFPKEKEKIIDTSTHKEGTMAKKVEKKAAAKTPVAAKKAPKKAAKPAAKTKK